MNRRDFIALCSGGAVAAPFAANAQQKTMPVVGVLYPNSPEPNFSPLPDPGSHGPVHRGLRETGFIDGQNVLFEYRYAEGHYERLPALAAELVNRKVDVIVTFDGTPTAMAAKGATSTIPIVFANVGDPVGVDLVASLSRPGGNMTGFTNMTATLAPKSIDLLIQLVPHAGAFGFLVNPNNPSTEVFIRNTWEAARAKGLNLSVQKASTAAEIEAAFTAFVQPRVDALIVMEEYLFMNGGWRARIAERALRDGIPTACQSLQFAADGGLIAYGVDETDEYHQAGIYAGWILNGARPADLPVQQPTTFKLVVNLKTAKALGLTVPLSILAAADELIE